LLALERRFVTHTMYENDVGIIIMYPWFCKRGTKMLRYGAVPSRFPVGGWIAVTCSMFSVILSVHQYSDKYPLSYWNQAYAWTARGDDEHN